MKTKRISLLLITGTTALLLIIFAITIILRINSNVQTVIIESSYPHYELDELVEKSHIIARGKIVSQSEPFLIKPTNGGDESVFTDYYIELLDVLRGEATAGDIVPIRLEGGQKGDWNVIDSDAELKIGDEAVAFLYQVNVGGGYTTNEDYYKIVGGVQGIYLISDDSKKAVGDVKKRTFDNLTDEDPSLIWGEASEEIVDISEEKPMDYDWVYKETMETMESNLERGMITQEEYDDALSAFDQYATRIED